MCRTTVDILWPSCREIRDAVAVYLDRAYGAEVPPDVASRIPPPHFDPARWLMSDTVERTPPGADAASCRSFALRLGNGRYPHMKLRVARVPAASDPGAPGFVFRVDTHDQMLQIAPGSHDEPALAALKAENAAVAEAINAAWEARGLPTERSFLRAKIAQLKAARE